jgi:autoinducer 2-degrading protein
MIVYCVTVYVKPENIDEFIAATVENHKGTRQEPGNLRFDVLHSADDPARFFLYEVYESKEAVDAHKATPHYNRWRETVADWMAKPREGLMQRVICPEGADQW